MLPLVSVIVPVYNTESYLDKCIQSILNQSYQNLEIILVNDGSKDGSPLKCDEYARLNQRVRVIHKENGGQSSARNAALDVCKGAYISFIDSDDWIEPEMYATLVGELEEHHADMAICGRCDAYENSEEITIGKRLGRNGLANAYDILPQMVLGQLSDFSVCDKLHRRNLWENVRFPEGEIYEDFAVMYRVVLAAKTVVLCDKAFYVYNHRGGSTVTSCFRESLTDYPKQTNRFLAYITSKYPEYTNYAIWSHIKAIQVVLVKLLRADRKTYAAHSGLYREYVADIKKYRPVWKRDPIFTAVDRLICDILLHRHLARVVFLLKKPT